MALSKKEIKKEANKVRSSLIERTFTPDTATDYIMSLDAATDRQKDMILEMITIHFLGEMIGMAENEVNDMIEYTVLQKPKMNFTFPLSWN